ncbi:hypothetical protein [Halopenitus persicus]|uniref:hypothetical protein n=1 Tax=Halopenitus persicus TaxID=1048396 RepID=UPI000BBA612B|nr:hypothetical protein [Halopenitus persicus]
MPVDRRTVLVAVATVGVGAFVGRSMLSDLPIDPGSWGSNRTVPPASETLHIPSGGEHVVSAGDAGSYRMIRWEDRGTLTIEPGGSLVLEGIDDA